MLPFIFITASNIGALIVCKGFPGQTFVEVGSTSSIEPPRCWAYLLPPSPSVAGSDRHARLPGVLSCGASITLPSTVVEALPKEWDDALGSTEDTRR